jgi:inhibitor of KinA
MKSPAIKLFGLHALLIEWPSEISEAIHRNVLETSLFLQNEFSEMIIDIVPAYCSLAIYLKHSISAEHFMDLVAPRLNGATEQPGERRHQFTLPVCYGNTFGPDLNELAESKGLTKSEVVRLHSNKTYRVTFIGFLPGFPYLMGLDSRLHMPRKPSPRSLVPQGSVGIAGGQTGVYPSASPGGWNLIGRTPVPLFSVGWNRPALFHPGDTVIFEEISETEFDAIEKAIKNNSFSIKKQKQYG